MAADAEYFTETKRVVPTNAAERILAEYGELRGLRLTARQAARLWALEPCHCERLLNQLVTEGHLYIDARGQYAWPRHAPYTHPSEPKASEAVA